MYKSKLSHLFCLLFSFLLLLASFGVSASAASDDNLIESDLTQWDLLDGSGDITVTEEYGLYRLYFTRQTFDNADFGIRSGAIYDLSDLKAGNSYTLSFFLPDYKQVNEILDKSHFTENSYYLPFKNYNGVLQIGLIDMSNTEFVGDFHFLINGDNYKDYFGKTNKITFELPNVKNPAIIIYYADVVSSGNNYALFVDDFKLIDNDAKDEEGFFDNLFQFFHDLKWEIVGGSCGDSECHKTPHKSLADKISTKFQEGIDGLKQFFHDLKWDVTGGTCDKADCPKREHTSLAGRINSHVDSFKESFQNKIDNLKQSVIDLKDGLIEGIKSLFVPDEAYLLNFKKETSLIFSDNLGFIYDISIFISDFLEKLGDLLENNFNNDFSFTFPGVEFDFLGYHIELWNDITLSFDFLNTIPGFNILYNLYKMSIHAMCIFILFAYAQKIYEDVLDSK